MSDTTLESAGLSRRSLMKVGLIGGAFLATAGVTASLTGCSAEKPASGLEKVRESDLPFLRALLPVMLLGAVSAEQMPKAVEGAIQSLTTTWRGSPRRCSSSPSNSSTCSPCRSPVAR